MIQHDLLKSSNVSHGFFTRTGGTSEGLYSSLNCGPGSNDVPAHVAENRTRVLEKLGASSRVLRTLYQIHSPNVVVVQAEWPVPSPQADALVTDRDDVVIGILTADCGPVLFADPVAGVVGAAHAGWKGAIGGVTDNTIEAMCSLGAQRKNIKAVLGPCIGPNSYEVKDEFMAPFLSQDAANHRFFEPARDGHKMFNLNAYVLMRLERAGVEHATTGHDTYPDEAQFFSYRRTTHRSEPDYGRQISAILLK